MTSSEALNWSSNGGKLVVCTLRKGVGPGAGSVGDAGGVSVVTRDS
ncbi:MAG: hypothetical protein P4L84_13040 [Isosphaeraceae bacterium]|nr:hypothetical protein [Isosphaeraceae bacterium]